MNRYESTTWKWKLAMAAVAVCISAGLLEAVTDGMSHPDATALAARQRVIAAQAEQVERARALERGEVKAADANAGARI